MALTHRQYWIMRALYKNQGEYIKSAYFANSLHCTIRTIQNDLRKLRGKYADKNVCTLETNRNLGTKLTVHNIQQFEELLDSQALTAKRPLDPNDQRLDQIFFLLIKNRRKVSLYKLSAENFLSESTVKHSLALLNAKLRPYSLKIIAQANQVILKGPEIFVRAAIRDLCLPEVKRHSYHPIIWNSRELISKSIENAFHSNQLSLSGAALQAATVFVQIGFESCVTNNQIKGDFAISNSLSLKIAKEICQQIANRWNFALPPAEIRYLAFYLENVTNIDFVYQNQAEFQQIIHGTLSTIDQAFATKCHLDQQLEASLLKYLPKMLNRIKYCFQFKNSLYDFTLANFPLAMYLASAFSSQVSQKTHFSPNQNELSLLSMLFQQSLRRQGIDKKRLLLITALNQAQSSLLVNLLETEFSNYISSVHCLTPEAVNSQDETLANYDLILTTESDPKLLNKRISKIVFPPDQKELMKINQLLAGYNTESFLNLFSPSLFFLANLSRKKEAINCLLRKTSQVLKDSGFQAELAQTNDYKSSYFKNGVAIVKPILPPKTKSFASVLLLKKGIPWGKGHTVSLIILLSISSKNPDLLLAYNDLAPNLFKAGWRQQLAGENQYSQFMDLIHARLNRLLIRNPNLQPNRS